MINEGRIKIAKKINQTREQNTQTQEDIKFLLISINVKLEKLISLQSKERIITVRGIAETQQTLKTFLTTLIDYANDLNTNGENQRRSESSTKISD